LNGSGVADLVGTTSSTSFTQPVATPLLEECEDDTHTPKMGTWEFTETPETSELDCRGQNTSHWVFFISLESYESVDVENGLAWAIWTSAAQVMCKRRAGSQIGNLTLDH
jgi:hypothetical protein